MLPAAGGWTDEALIPVALALSFALIEFDDDIRGWARGEFATDRLRPVARAFKPLGDRSTVFLGLGAWAVGSASGAEDIADAGLHTSAALLTTGTAVSLLKVGAGRWRPSVGAGAEDFGLGRGAFPLDNRAQSFPSGHTATAFAIAASLSEEAKRHWPEQERWLTPALYAAAGLVGLSRVLDDAHWTSDVLFGAALGTVAGRTSIRRLHRP
jgi:membrane-associated phospholipid phosphatase